LTAEGIKNIDQRSRKGRG